MFTGYVWSLPGTSKVAIAKQFLCEEQGLNSKQKKKKTKKKPKNHFPQTTCILSGKEMKKIFKLGFLK